MAFSAPLNGSGLGEIFTHNTGGTSDAYAMAQAPAVGQSMRLVAAAGSGGQSVTNVTSPGMRWRQDATAGAALSCDIWTGYCDGLSGTPTGVVTVTTAIAATAQRVNITLHNGSGKWPPVHARSSATATSTTMDGGSITPTAGYDYLVMACGRFLSGTAPTLVDAVNWTALTGANGYAFAYRILTAHGGAAINCAWTIASVQWEASICAIRVSPSATITDAHDALMAAFGQTDYTKAGRFKFFYDARLQALTALESGVQMVTSHADRVNDYRGAGWGAGDMQCGGGTNANGPTQGGTPGVDSYLVYNGSSQWTQSLTTNTDTDMSTVTGLTVATVASCTGNGGIGGIFRDPTATTAPYMCNAAASGKYGLSMSSYGSTIDTGVATGSTIRLLLAQRYDLVSGTNGMNDVNSGDQRMRAKVGGRRGKFVPWAVGAGGSVAFAGVEFASGANYVSIGRQGANYATIPKFYCQVGISGMLTQTQMAALEAWSEAQYAAVMDNGFKDIQGVGASFEQGLDDSAAFMADPPMPYAMTVSTGPLGTLAARGYDTVGVNVGISARTLAFLNAVFATEIAPSIDRRRPGVPVLFIGDVLYNSAKTQNLATIQSQLATFDALCATAGCYYVIYTVMSGFYQYAANAFNPATAPSAAGSVVIALNDWLATSGRASLSRCRGIQNYETDAHLKVATPDSSCVGVQACADTAYYGVAGGHFINAGYQYIGTTRAQYIGANPGVLSSGSRRIAGVMRPR